MAINNYGVALKKILICEDEKLIAVRLSRFIAEAIDFPADIQIVSTLNQAFEYLSKNKIDLLFLDLNLHGKDGFEILKKLTSEAFHTIIVSAYTEKAIEAYEYGVLDFVGKPFTLERLKKAIARFSKDDIARGQGLKYIAIKIGKRIAFIALEDIDYIQAAGIYSELILKDGTIKVYDKPMNQLIKLLPTDFKRVHKSFVVPLNHVKSIVQRKANAHDIELQSGRKIPVSRAMRKALIKLLAL